MTKPSTTVVNIRLDTPTIEAIRAVAEAEGRTWAGQVRYILAGWMRERECGWERMDSHTIRDRPDTAGRAPNSALYAKPRDRVGGTPRPQPAGKIYGHQEDYP